MHQHNYESLKPETVIDYDWNYISIRKSYQELCLKALALGLNDLTAYFKNEKLPSLSLYDSQ